MSYELDEPYPAATVIGFLTGALEKDGWTKSTDDLFNPGSPLFDERGWQSVIIKGERVFSWSGQWEDSAKNLVLYGLSYRVPTVEYGASPSGPLRVQGLFIAAERAAAYKEYRSPK